jgi:hydroxymethylglutaryl-CoA lyase
MRKLNIIECPRDAMQSIKEFIPTDKKIKYVQSLLEVGFDTIDVGSFVSKKVIPQLSDTGEVINSLDLSKKKSDLLVIIANIKGAEIASNYNQITYVGFPFSISENFQMRNTNKTINESFISLVEINKIVSGSQKNLVVYLSMCFGNPYGEVWNLDVIDKSISKLVNHGFNIISLSDTIGSATPSLIEKVYQYFSLKYPEVEFGLHLHTHPKFWRDKIDSSFNSGCNRIDGAIQGFGGCPMASDNLIGNMPTEKIISYCQEKDIETNINPLKFEAAYNYASDIFLHYH